MWSFKVYSTCCRPKMISRRRSMMIVIQLLMLLAMVLSFSGAMASSGHMSVDIINGVEDPIDVYCKSRTKDLGEHTIAPKQQYGFGFKPNFWGTTKYWCRFIWGNKITYFMMVWQDESYLGLRKRPCRACVYLVRSDGVYRADGNGPFALIYRWAP